MLEKAHPIAFIGTSNPSESLVFYRDLLEFSFVTSDEYAFILKMDSVYLRIVKVAPFEPLPFTVLGWHVKNIQVTVDLLRKKGLKFERYENMKQDKTGIVTFPNGDKVAWFKDPDGNLLSITQF